MKRVPRTKQPRRECILPIAEWQPPQESAFEREMRESILLHSLISSVSDVIVGFDAGVSRIRCHSAHNAFLSLRVTAQA